MRKMKSIGWIGAALLLAVLVAVAIEPSVTVTHLPDIPDSGTEGRRADSAEHSESLVSQPLQEQPEEEELVPSFVGYRWGRPEGQAVAGPSLRIIVKDRLTGQVVSGAHIACFDPPIDPEGLIARPFPRRSEPFAPLMEMGHGVIASAGGMARVPWSRQAASFVATKGDSCGLLRLQEGDVRNHAVIWIEPCQLFRVHVSNFRGQSILGAKVSLRVARRNASTGELEPAIELWGDRTNAQGIALVRCMGFESALFAGEDVRMAIGAQGPGYGLLSVPVPEDPVQREPIELVIGRVGGLKLSVDSTVPFRGVLAFEEDTLEWAQPVHPGSPLERPWAFHRFQAQANDEIPVLPLPLNRRFRLYIEGPAGTGRWTGLIDGPKRQGEFVAQSLQLGPAVEGLYGRVAVGYRPRKERMTLRLDAEPQHQVVADHKNRFMFPISAERLPVGSKVRVGQYRHGLLVGLGEGTVQLEDERRTLGEVRLQRGDGLAHGQVLEARGLPVRGVRVEFWVRGQASPYGSAITDGRGRYRLTEQLTALPAGEEFLKLIIADGTEMEFPVPGRNSTDDWNLTVSTHVQFSLEVSDNVRGHSLWIEAPEGTPRRYAELIEAEDQVHAHWALVPVGKALVGGELAHIGVPLPPERLDTREILEGPVRLDFRGSFRVPEPPRREGGLISLLRSKGPLDDFQVRALWGPEGEDPTHSGLFDATGKHLEGFERVPSYGDLQYEMLVPGYKPEVWTAGKRRWRWERESDVDPVVEFRFVGASKQWVEERGRMRFLEFGSGPRGDWQPLERFTLWHGEWRRRRLPLPATGRYEARMLYQTQDGVWHEEWTRPITIRESDRRKGLVERSLHFRPGVTGYPDLRK